MTDFMQVTSTTAPSPLGGEGWGERVPQAVQPMVTFPALLRVNGFAVAPDQTISFVKATGLLGPRSIEDIRLAAIATLAVAPDRRGDFNALFDSHFLGAPLPQAMPGDEEEAEAHEGVGATQEIPDDPADDPGQDATAAERLGYRDLIDRPDTAIADLRRHGPKALPRRRSRRLRASQDGQAPDLRRALRDAVRRDGEILTLPRRQRQTRQRKIVLLIDVSGSMAARTEAMLRLAHTLARVAERAEIFTLGTRLTRVTPALRLANPMRALDRAASLIADIDGGTRIGEALTAFLSVPRYAGFARGAAVIVLSDGLERGEAQTLTAATQRLKRLAWRLDWLSPLATDGLPQTEAMRAITPLLDSLGDGATTEAITRHLLQIPPPGQIVQTTQGQP